MRELESRFNVLATEWAAHCAKHRESSNPAVFTQHESFDALVALGPQALPLIIDQYREGSLFWGAVLARITGNAQFGTGTTGNLNQTRRDWLHWWDQQGASKPAR